jgi:diguanylate cyclase (GGDEF)-like protein
MNAERCTLLIVDDEPYLLQTLRALLSPTYNVLTAANADEAEATFADHSIHVLLTDQNMPRRTGVQLLEWAREHHPRTIRLLMTGYSDLDDAVDAINRGKVYQYLLKPWRTEDLLQSIRNAYEKYQLEQSRDELLQTLHTMNINLERLVKERTLALQKANELLEERNRELQRLAHTDPLTGLLNRRAIEEMIDFELKRVARFSTPIAIGYIDIDYFKEINTVFTHAGGDEAIREVGKTLASSLREVDSIARIGGEEFLVLARETPPEGAFTLAERLREAVRRQVIPTQYGEIRLTVSAGFAVGEGTCERQQLLMLAAETLNEAKRTGRNRSIVRTLNHSIMIDA